jgi:AcrR family transcriptional regulator
MRMPSDLSTTRRIPQQERGERRVAQVLEAAASVFAEVGYDAATMTEISERAEASIGAVYQYFPNKEAIVRALRNQFGIAMEQRWAEVELFTEGISVEQMAHRFVDVMVHFVEDYPAYFSVFDAPVKYKRDQEARNRLRLRLVNVFRSRQPELSPELAFRIAHVSLQIIKSMTAIYAEASAHERPELVKEYKLALAGYLRSHLPS